MVQPADELVSTYQIRAASTHRAVQVTSVTPVTVQLAAAAMLR